MKPDEYKQAHDSEETRSSLDADFARLSKQGKFRPSISNVSDTKVGSMANVSDVGDKGFTTTTGVPLSHPLELITMVLQENPWADTAVKTIGAACASTEPLFNIFDKSDDDSIGRNTKLARKKKINNIKKKLLKPNKHQTGYELMLTTFENLAAYGNAYWQIIRTIGGEIHSIFTLPPETMRVVPYFDVNGVLHCAYYQMNIVTNTRGNDSPSDIYLEDEIIHFKETNEKSFLYGKPRVYSLFGHITNNAQSMAAINSWFEKGFSGGAIFHMDAEEDVVDRNREFIRDNYSGARNYGEVVILEGEIKLIDNGQKFVGNINFNDLEGGGRDAILVGMGVPISMAAVRSSNGLGNAEIVASEEKAFKRNVIDKYHRLVYDKIESRLFDDMLQDDEIGITAGALSKFTSTDEVNIVNALAKLGIKISEAREILGVKPLGSAADNTTICMTNNGPAKFGDVIGIDPDTGDAVETLFDKTLNSKASNSGDRTTPTSLPSQEPGIPGT
jgi:HK97 family phage portal protein